MPESEVDRVRRVAGEAQGQREAALLNNGANGPKIKTRDALTGVETVKAAPESRKG